MKDDPEAEKPRMVGCPPARIIREDGVCRLHPLQAEGVKLIFRPCIAGHSTNQIAYKVNTDGVLATDCLGALGDARTQYKTLALPTGPS